MRTKILLYLLLLFGLGTGLALNCVLVQSQTREKPKLKDFGSSLRKLKWDPQRNETGNNNPNGKTDDDDVVTIDTTLVASDLLVVDKQGRTVHGLKETDFAISEDGTPQQVGHFLLGDNAKVGRSIVLIIDYSGSQFPYIKDSVEAARLLVDKLGPLDTMAIVTDDVEMLVDFTSDKGTLKKKLDSLLERLKGKKGFLGVGARPGKFGRSAQYSSLMATLKEAFDNEDQRPIIVFQTDGDEAAYLRNPIIVPSVPPNLPPELKAEAQEQVEQELAIQRRSMTEFSLEDVYRAVEKSRATIYTVVPGFRLLGLTPEQQMERLKADDERRMATWVAQIGPKTSKAFIAARQERLERTPIEAMKQRVENSVKVQSALAEVANLAGGSTEFLERPSQAQEIYSRIFADINERYIVGYYPSNKVHDGKRRKI